MNWLDELFDTKKVIIGMCHLLPLPGDPYYNKVKGLNYVITKAYEDLLALQEGGVDGIMFSNEYSLPYLTNVGCETVTSMAYIIGELKKYIEVPFGVDVLWDAKKTVDLAVATGASFAREIFTGIYASDFGLWNTNIGETIRHKINIGGDEVKLLFNIVPEAAKYLSDRDIIDIAKSTVFNNRPDALCISGLTAGAETKTELLKKVKDILPDTIVFANTGVKAENVVEQLAIADGAVVGTAFKFDGKFENHVDKNRVKIFMDIVKKFRN